MATVTDEIETSICELLWDIFTKRVCEHCDAVYVDKGTRFHGMQLAPDELRCPAEFEPDEPTCVHAKAWKDLAKMAGEMAEMIDWERDD